jgi:hypothetical protein
MPTHNRATQLEKAATSVLSQQFAAIELVIVDDASSDHTPSVTERLMADPRVRVVRTPESLGPGGARNEGIAVARGDFLGFCDDDDAWLPGAASTLLGHLEANQDLGAVTSWHRVVHDHSGRSVGYRGPTRFGADDLLWFNFVALPFGVIRRSWYPEGPLFDRTLPTCEDWDVWLRCAQVRPIEAVPLMLYQYHQHGGDRVTKVSAGVRVGRQGFLDKHADSMTEGCQIYHQAVIAQQAQGRGGLLNVLARAGATRPAAASLAASVLATSFAASSVGVRRLDPGLSARLVRRELGLLPGRHHAAVGGR